MKFNKFEIVWFTILVICMSIIVVNIIYFDSKVKIEEEKTKQLEIQTRQVETVDG